MTFGEDELGSVMQSRLGLTMGCPENRPARARWRLRLARFRDRAQVVDVSAARADTDCKAVTGLAPGLVDTTTASMEI